MSMLTLRPVQLEHDHAFTVSDHTHSPILDVTVVKVVDKTVDTNGDHNQTDEPWRSVNIVYMYMHNSMDEQSLAACRRALALLTCRITL